MREHLQIEHLQICLTYILQASHVPEPFAWELVKRAWSRCVDSMGTTTLAVVVAIAYVIFEAFRIYRASGRIGFREHWRHGLSHAFMFFLGTWGCLFLIQILHSIPDEIREAADKIGPPAVASRTSLPTAWDLTSRSAGVSLPPIHRTDSFITFLVFNSNNLRSPLVCPSNLLKAAVCSEFNGVVSRNVPLDEQAWRTFLGVAMQHYLVSLVGYAGTGYGMHSESHAVIFKDIPPVDIPDEQTFELGRVCSFADADRSLITPSLMFVHTLKLPKASKCALTTRTNPVTHVLRFERVGYYKLDLGVTVVMKTEKGQIPQGFEVPFADTSGLITYYCRISSELSVHRVKDPTFITDEYTKWSQKLLENIRGKFEEPGEPPDIIYGR
jgi:hypothetical protein